IDEGDRGFFDPGNSAYLLLPGAGQWREVRNYIEAGGGEADGTSTNYVWPFQTETLGTQTKARYRELRENLDGTYPLWPLTLLGTNPDRDIWGDLDGAFAVTGFNNASENIVRIGATDYLVVQNLHRTARYYYCAVKLE